MLATVANSKDMQQAADKLCVSPSALSHQMKRLEERIGKKLFFKDGRNQKLLPHATTWVNRLSESFVSIEKETSKFINHDNKTIHLGVPSAIAFNRITPFLSLWLHQHSNLDVRIRMLNCEDKPEELNLDAVLTTPFKSKQYDGEVITSEKYIPVCSKQFYDNIAVESRDNLFNSAPLLELNDVSTWQAWKDYFSVPLQAKSVIYFSHTILLLQAVLSDQGIALLDYHLVKPQLEKGQLVQLTDKPMELEGQVHYFAITNNRQRDKNIIELKSWIKSLFN